MKTITIFICISILSIVATGQQLESSDYHTHRDPLSNSFNKFLQEKTGRIAFLGGSITFNGGWRDSLMDYFQERFPETEFDFIAAGIPSMGSPSGAFRFERDVLKNGPVDLLFEEAAVNDVAIEHGTEEIELAMEGIVRHALKANPYCDIIMMHFVDPGKMEDYRKGLVPEVIRIHEKIAAHYGVPTINLAREVTERIDAGEFDWENDFRNLHPSPFGQGVYSRSMIRFLDDELKTENQNQNYSRKKLKKPIRKGCYDSGKLILPDQSFEKKGWAWTDKWNPNDGLGTRANYINVPMLVGEYPGEILNFGFSGNAVGICVAAGKDAGKLEYRIDGGEWQEIDLFTKHSRNLHLPRYYTLASELKNKRHNLEMRLSGNRNENSDGNKAVLRYFYVNGA